MTDTARITSVPRDQRLVRVLSYVGNPGCIRFPPVVRKVAGVKRNDRLVVTVTAPNTLVLEKRAPGDEATETSTVAACTCTTRPAGCADASALSVMVGWSYVQLPESLAREQGLSTSAPILLTAETSRITVSLCAEPDLVPAGRVQCPP